MNRRTINIVLILGIISVLSILLVQMISINKTAELHVQNVEIQQRQDSLNYVHFKDRTFFALRNVLDKISTGHQDSSDIFEAVKLIDSNYFKVDFSIDLDPFQLETWLTRELYDQNLHHDFQYAIYDCFDSVTVYSPLISYTKSGFVADSSVKISPPSYPFDNTDHYFTVYFPDVGTTGDHIVAEVSSPYYYLILIVALILIFFGYTISVILKQKRLSEVKTDFINNMTHELKTPISSIGLCSETIMRTDPSHDPEKIQKYAGLIFKENKRLENQVERVLNIAKLDRKELSIKKEVIDIHEFLTELKDNFDFNQDETGVNIQLELNADSGVIHADSVHISNVLYNLVDNAIKYCNTKPKIRIVTNRDKKYFSIDVIDNGIGIKREDLKMIFDKFYRVPTGNLHDVKGFGLGLYYVKTIIEEHGGSITAKSTIGKGTSFAIKLPV